MHRIDLMKESGCVRLLLVGEVTRSDVETARSEAAVALGKFGWNKLLIDTTTSESKISDLDNYEITIDHDSYLPRTLRTAIVHLPSEIETLKFIENVGVNRGMNMRLFTNEREALDWLLNG